MIEYLYYMLYLLVILMVIYKIKLIILIKMKKRELRNKKNGFILYNHINSLKTSFIKKNGKKNGKYEFTVYGFGELILKDNKEMTGDSLRILPLEINLAHEFCKYLIFTKRIDFDKGRAGRAPRKKDRDIHEIKKLK